MAKVKKLPITLPAIATLKRWQAGKFQFPNKTKSWLENKSKAVRKLWQPQASRFSPIKRSERKTRGPRGIKLFASLIIPLGLALIILLLGYSLFTPKDEFQIAKERLVKNPADFQAHLILAEKYLDNNQLVETEKELLLAEKYQPTSGFGELMSNYSSPSVLGAATSKLAELWQREKENDPQKINYLIDQWENIIARRPDYRDGYLQLVILNYKIYEDKKAHQYLDQALELDPNFETTKELGKIIE